MSKPNDVSAIAEDGDAEIEFSADDLLALSVAGASEDPSPDPMTSPAALSIPPACARPSIDRTPARRMALSVGAVVAIVAAGGLFNAQPFTGNTLEASSSLGSQQRELSPPKPVLDIEPVRFVNPFDPNEVFEFPPGTSEASAREAVAELLMDRAVERQARTYSAG
jgi:hypothetical protein